VYPLIMKKELIIHVGGKGVRQRLADLAILKVTITSTSTEENKSKEDVKKDVEKLQDLARELVSCNQKSITDWEMGIAKTRTKLS
jgi:hypothetical protein